MSDDPRGSTTVEIDDAPASAPMAAERWTLLGGRPPASIETLKPAKRKSAVYLLRGAAAVDVVAKRALASTLHVERAAYGVLDRLPVSSVRCFGMVNEPGTAYAWLFTEHIKGDPFSGGNADHRTLAGRWLAAVHLAASSLADDSSMPRRDAAHYLTVVRSAAHTIRTTRANPAFVAEDGWTLDRIVEHCQALERAWSQVEEIATALPPTLVHGGFGPKNVRIRDRVAVREVFAFDWEAGGWGTPAADLASVDPEAYHGVLARSWPAVTLPSIVQLALLGRLLASASAIPGERRSLESAWPHRVMAKMRVYERRLADALRALGMEG